jgi:uroporphyrinogen III methyltransferase / synthase
MTTEVNENHQTVKPGTVYLIGAGPGDPGLLTIRGKEALECADAVVYDRLAHPALLNYVRPNAERIYVGKASANHAMKQPDINATLVRLALEGKTVARLKGGDPLVFGRGGEEAEICREHGVPFEFVPGVTSAIAAGTYAGIPITHRDAASSFAVITGHEREDDASKSQAGAAEGRRNWARLAWAADTLVFLMGVENLHEITSRLIENGRSPETPVGIVQWGTWSKQRVVTGTLSTIVQVVKDNGITSPAVSIVGDVVSLREKLRWFDDPVQRPLFGKKVLVTRAREQASGLSASLRALGADPVEFPAIKIVPERPYTELKSALADLAEYGWLVFTSVNAVTSFAEALEDLGLDARALSAIKVAAIGPATALEVKTSLGIRPDFVPQEAVAEAVLAGWPDKELTGKRVLMPRAKEAREVLPNGLRALGATVDVIPVYTTILDGSGSEELLQLLKDHELSALTFTSSSTVTNFIQSLGSPSPRALTDLIGATAIISIGPITTNTLLENGITPSVTAAEHTIPGVLSALTAYFGA